MTFKEAQQLDDHDWGLLANELPYCRKCHCYEGGTTTMCPGKTVPYDVSQAVYTGKIDFRHGKWCNQPAIGMCHIYGLDREPFIEIENVEEYIK